MPRTVKDPEERKAELLDTAMRLFAEKGYDNVSVRSVAREAGVAPGLAYHYFDSKQRLFDAAIAHYAEECSEGMRAVLDDRGLSLDEKLEGAIAVATDHSAFPHAGSLHAEGNGTLHDRLSLGICEAAPAPACRRLSSWTPPGGGARRRRGAPRLDDGPRVRGPRVRPRHARRRGGGRRQALPRSARRRVPARPLRTVGSSTRHLPGFFRRVLLTIAQ